MKITEIPPAPSSPEPKFSINSSYQSFADRQKSLFDQLDIAEYNSRNLLSHNDAPMDTEDFNNGITASTTVNDDDSVSQERSRNRGRMRQFQGKESIFKKPQARPPRGIPSRRFPDYQINPHKWTRYSLGDVKSEDMSERANTAAAMSFLKELESRKSHNESGDSETPNKIVFKKAAHKAEKEDLHLMESPSTSCFRNSKVIMPEYVVGQKKVQKRKAKRVQDSNATKEILLGHLHEDEDDNDEDD